MIEQLLLKLYLYLGQTSDYYDPSSKNRRIKKKKIMF